MARIRSIKPEIRTSEKVNAWPVDVRYFWVLLWGFVDDEGKGRDNPKLIVADAYPLDDAVTSETVVGYLGVLEAAAVIVRYEVAGERYFKVKNWSEHQKISHPGRSVIPNPPTGSGPPPEGRGSAPEGFRSQSDSVLRVSEEVSAKQGAGSSRAGSGEPPRKCPNHINDVSSPACYACRDARVEWESWDLARKNKPTVAGIYTPDNFCPIHEGYILSPECDRCLREEAEAGQL